MLNRTEAVANLAVRDLGVAKNFYEGTLGFKPVARQGDELVTYSSGDSTFNVYRSQYAGTNKATAVTWAVGDAIDSTVQALRAKGIEFEHYDMPGMTVRGDLHIQGDMKVAWFKDPDGNVLNLVNQ